MRNILVTLENIGTQPNKLEVEHGRERKNWRLKTKKSYNEVEENFHYKTEKDITNKKERVGKDSWMKKQSMQTK
jgi:hypothetical protein